MEVLDERSAFLRFGGENAQIGACSVLLRAPVQFSLVFEAGEASHVFRFYEEQKTVLSVFYEGIRLTAVNYAGPETIQRFVEDIQKTELKFNIRASVDGQELFVMEIDSVDKRGFLGLSNLVWAIAGGAGCVVLLSLVLIVVVACGRRRQKARRHYQRTEISMGPFPPQELEVCVGECADARESTPVQASRRRSTK